MINQGEKLPNNAILFTADVIGLFTNIPQQDGTNATREALEEGVQKSVPTYFIERLLELVLKCNIFEFDSKM